MRTAFWIFIFGISFSTTVKSQSVSISNAQNILKRVEQSNDTIYVVNFWATWCAPCVEELPIFNTQELSELHQPIQVILVSLDFNGQIDTKLKPFLKQKDINETVVWLNEKNPNTWVDLVDPSWSGAIPATKIYYQNKKVFHEGELDEPELKSMIQSIL